MAVVTQYIEQLQWPAVRIECLEYFLRLNERTECFPAEYF